MENRLNYPKAILFLLSGLVALTLFLFLGPESKAYGFLLGYGSTASVGGLAAIAYVYFKEQQLKKRGRA